MIAQLVSRGFLESAFDTLGGALADEAAALDAKDADAAARAAEASLSPSDLRAAAHRLGQASQELKDGGDDEEGDAMIPRDAVASLLQSSLERFFEEKTSMIRTDSGRGLAAEEVPISDEVLVAAAVPARKLGDAFGQTDPRWAAVWFAEAVRAARGSRQLSPLPTHSVKLANRARVLLVGDWGTGVPRAQKVARAMRALLVESSAATFEKHVIHLGDVYYSGWAREYDKHFLRYWPVKSAEVKAVTSWCLNGNHDMYSGGFGYFDHLLVDSRFAAQERSSVFSLENDYWQLLGLDTSHEDNALAGDQANWALQRRRQSPRKKGMLLSHHQPFSAYEEDEKTPALKAKLQPLIDEGLVRAWFWGHEHRCALYNPHDSLRFGRCIGHGGVPVYASSGSIPASVAYEYREYLSRGWENFARFGFAALDFDGPTIHIRYINENGNTHFEEMLE